MNGERPCDVGGCKARVSWSSLADHHAMRVTHGDNGEASSVISFDDLFIHTGYKPWVERVHQYEAQRPHNYEVAR